MSATQQEPAASNGAAERTIGVENPATGETDHGRSRFSAPTSWPRWPPGPVRRSPRGRRSGSRLAGGSCAARSGGCSTTRSACSMRSSQETGKTYEDAQIADFGYTASALGFWAKEGPKYLADERVPSWNNPIAIGKKLIIRYAPVGLVGVIGPWNYPIANSFGDCIPALMAGNAVILKPSEVTPLSSFLMAEMLEECGIPENVFQIATGDGGTGAALIEPGRLRHVHRLQPHRQGGHEGRGRCAGALLPGARAARTR